MPKEFCLHCKSRISTRPRGLCSRCYDKTPIRKLYAPKPGSYRDRKEPTEEELDRLIEQQKLQLPSWWSIANENMDTRDRPKRPNRKRKKK